MITSYEVGSVYKIVDQATPTLIKIAVEAERIQKAALGAAESLAALGRFRGTALLRTLASVEKNMVGVAGAAAKTETSLITGFAKADASIATTAGAVGRLTAELRAADAAAQKLRIPQVRPGGGGGGTGPTVVPGIPGGGGGGGSGGGSGGHGNNWNHVGVGLGMAGFFGVHEIGHGLKEILKHASELEHVRQQMIQAGFKEHDIGEAMAKSWEQAEKYGLNVAKVMGDIKELVLPFGSVEHAIEFIEPLEKMRIVLNAVKEGKGNESAEAVYKMARAGELKGLQDPKDFLSYFDNMTKAISASGGKITPNDFMQVAKYGKLSTMGFDEEFFTKYLPTLMQTMGASTAGTSLQSLFGTLVQGTVTKRALGRMDDIGLIADPSKITYDKKGDPKGFNPGAIEGTDMLIKNPFKWAQTVLLPLLEKKYGSLDETANKEKAIEDLGGLFGNRNSAAAIAELALRGKTFNKDAGLVEQAQGLGGSDRLQKEDPNSAAARLKGAWENLMTAIGGPGVKVAVDGMNSLASGITSMTKWANENPGTMKIVLEGMVGLGIAFTALTVAGVVAAAALLIPGGAVALAVTTLVSVLGTIAAFNWESIKGADQNLKPGYLATIAKDFKEWVTAIGSLDIKGVLTGSLKGLNDLMLGIPLEMAKVVKDITVALGATMAPIATAIGAEIMSWPGKLAETIAGMGAAIVAKIKEALGGLLGGLFSRTSFDGAGGGAGGLIQNASLGGSGAANDNGVGRALRGGSDGGGGGPIPALPSSVQMTPAERNTLGLIMQHESHGRNTMNYMGRAQGLSPSTARGYTAQGYFQMLNSNWRRIAPRLGITAPNAMAGSLEDQTRVALELLRKGGIQNWSNYNPALRNALRRGDRAPARAPAAPPPTAGPPPRQGEARVIQANLHVDGKKMAQVVVRHAANAAKYPKHVGGQDTHGSWGAPGTTLTDAA